MAMGGRGEGGVWGVAALARHVQPGSLVGLPCWVPASSAEPPCPPYPPLQFILETAPAQKADRRGSRHGAPDDQHYPPHLALGGGGGGGISRPPSAEAGGLPRPRSRPPKGEQQQQHHHQQQEQQRRSSGDG